MFNFGDSITANRPNTNAHKTRPSKWWRCCCLRAYVCVVLDSRMCTPCFLFPFLSTGATQLLFIVLSHPGGVNVRVLHTPLLISTARNYTACIVSDRLAGSGTVPTIGHHLTNKTEEHWFRQFFFFLIVYSTRAAFVFPE